MADAVQQRVEAGLEELHALTQRQVLTEEETRQILRKRRDFEFECSSRHGDTVRAFLVYIHYEVNLLTLLRLRCRTALDANRSRLQQLQQQQRLLRVQRQQQKKQKATRKERERLQRDLQRQQQQEQRQQRRIARAKDLLHAVVRTGARRVYRLCRRLLQRHSTSLALWYSCLDLLLQLGSTRQLQQLLLHALRQFPCCSGLWILAANRLLQQGQLLAARRMLLTALRFNSTSVALWTELLRLEAAAALRKAEALNRQQHDQQQQQQDTLHGCTSLDSGGDVRTQQHETAVAPRAATEKTTTAAERKEEEEGEGGGGRATRRAPQVQGDAILVVLKAAVEKLGQRPRRPGSSRAAAAAAAQEEAACNSRSNGGKLPVAVVDSRVQDFLLRALELCLGLQASEAAGLMQQLLLPPLQQQVSLLLHEQAQQQPLLRVYEWKVLLLQAVTADASAQAAEEAAEDSSSSDGSPSALDVSSRMDNGSEEEGCSGGNSNSKSKGAVCEVFENILKECETQPHLLLLVALLLRALLTSSSSKTPPATAARASGEKRGTVATQDADEEIFCVFDVEGDAEAAAEGATNATNSSSGETATKGGRGAATGTVSGAAGQLQTGAHLVERYGGAHADADLLARYAAAGEEDNAAAARETAGVADQSATGGEAGEAVYDARALQLLEVLSETGWPQVLLLLQRQPRLGRACLLLLQADVPTKEGAAGGTAIAAGDMLAGPQLLQLQRETLWTALWDAAAAVPAAEGKGQPHEQRLWLIESLLRALQQLHEHQQQQRTGLMKNGCAASKRSSGEQVTVAAAAAYGALGHLLVELLERAAAHVQASSSEDEVYEHLKPLQQVRQRLQQFTESFLKQQQQQEIDSSSLRKQHQQQVAQLLLLLLDIRKGNLLARTHLLQQQQQQERCDAQRLQPVSKKTKHERQGKTEEVEQKEQPQKATLTADLEVLRKLNSSLGVAEAAGLLEHHLRLSSQELRSCRNKSSKRLETEEDAAAATAVAAGREEGPVHELPVWFQDLLAAAAPAALPVLVQRFCQHGLMQVQQLMQEQLAQQEEDDAGVDNCFEGLISQQQHKRRKLVLGKRRQLPGSAATVSAAAEVEAKRRREVWCTETFADTPVCLPRGWLSPIPAGDVAAVARVAAVLQWTSSCVSSLNDSSCCMRLCSAARLTVFTEVCNFAIQALWHSIARCWASAAAAAPLLLGEAASDWWSEALVALLQQTREVYACALAVFERCGMQQQLPVQDERGGRGRRLQQQGEVLRRHVLQHVTNASQQQVQWWVDFWRFTRFCEEAAGLLQLQQSSRSRLPQSRAPGVARPARERCAAKDLTAASFFGMEKREETERQAEQSLGEGSAALVAFREAVAAEVATPCEVQSHYPGGCTACGVNRLWCAYTAATHATVEIHAASDSSTRRVL